MFKDKPTTTTTEEQPASGEAVRPLRGVPAYKLRKKLDEMDLMLKHPHLSRKWRRRMASQPMEQTGKVPRGRKAPRLDKESQ